MKINEIPEKIYLDYELDEDKIHIFINYMWHRHPFNDKNLINVEYTRTDALIDKAAIWFNNNFIVHDEYGVISDSFDTKEEMFENFKNYIKVE